MLIDLLKLVAVWAMVADHVGALLMPGEWGLRLVGRVAAPIFACLAGWHAVGSRHPWRYVLRLAVWALVAQPVFIVAFGPGTANVLFGLGLGVLVAQVRSCWPVVALGLVALAEAASPWRAGIALDGGIALVALVALVAYLRRAGVFDGAWLRVPAAWASGFSVAILAGVSHLAFGGAAVLIAASAGVAALWVVSRPWRLTMGWRLPLPWWAFYGFYPGHMAVLVVAALVY